ncbi:MAG: 50S ribosomal protein L11 methyltransferase, partial [Burkholderiaceae bacterium]|nr:50S ribosomal protein L11 methyltransferase [Burkholderiaceae bacterium]
MAALRELVFTITAEAFDGWSDALLAAGALSVQAQDADADSPDEQALYGEPGAAHERAGWQRTRISALIGDRVDADALLARAAGAIGSDPPASRELREVPDQDWVGSSQSQFEPIRIGTRMLVTPTWHLESVARETPGADGERPITIVLDPGLAFGTGSHATTRLCLHWLCDEPIAGHTLIDYGCGSGILAIAAAKLGASHVLGVDIDPQAVAATIANARANAVEVAARRSTDAPPEPADIVIANILSSPLKVLAPMLGALVRPGGR